VSRLFCQEHPEILRLETEVVDVRPGRVRLAQSPFFPGGGGQLADRGVLRWGGGEAAVVGLEPAESGGWWHLLDRAGEPSGVVEVSVDPAFRQMMRELHTGAHILNALVFREFDGALITGAQLGADGTARVDFDLPGADNDRLRALDGAVNDVVAQDLRVGIAWVDAPDVASEPGMVRTRSVAPPPSDDGQVRVVEIVGLDRQACGGTHLTSTGASRPLRILKIDNKGRHNRRVRYGLVDGAPERP
jgi:misacylated tRNA(Ala) deacylase